MLEGKNIVDFLQKLVDKSGKVTWPVVIADCGKIAVKPKLSNP